MYAMHFYLSGYEVMDNLKDHFLYEADLFHDYK